MGKGQKGFAFPLNWGNLRHNQASFVWLPLILVLFQVLPQEQCAVDGLPLEVEGALELSGGNNKEIGMRLIPQTTDEMERPAEGKQLSQPKIDAVKLLLHKFKQMEEEAAEREEVEEELERSASEARTENARAIWVEDYERRAAELCGTKASLECGKRILSLIDGQEGGLDVHMKCDLRDDFLKCIDLEKKVCLDMAKGSMLPDLPSKDVIKGEQSKLWKVLWTAGGCVLAN